MIDLAELIARIEARQIKALSIKQPYPHHIFHDGKDVENRDWPTKGRGWFVCHPKTQCDATALAWFEHKADADTCAAAPDLRDALRECADDLEAEIESRRGCVLDRTMERDLATVRKARAALAKAEGK